MKIAINARWLLPDKLEGFGWYSLHVVKDLTLLLPDAEFHLLYDRKLKAPLIEGLNVINHVVFPQARHTFLWYIWNEVTVPLKLRMLQPDIYFSPDGFLPSKPCCTQFTTIHDLNFEQENAFIAENVRRYYRKHIRQAAEVADHVFTVSNYSANDILSRYNIAPEKVSWAHNGPQKMFTDKSARAHSARQRWAISKPYFLFVGAQNPRKNLHRIFAAFDAFVETTKSNHMLVLAGEKMFWDEEITTAFNDMAHKDRVSFTGRVSTDDLNRLYSAATALVYPSLFEGFGMPIVEAFYAGCPVLTSTTTCMPEVAGDAALLVNPTETDEITAALVTLATDTTLAQTLRQRGFERAPQFSWRNVAQMIATKMLATQRA